MPIMDGVATTKELGLNFPEIKVLILTTFDDDEYISQAMNYGVVTIHFPPIYQRENKTFSTFIEGLYS